VASIGVVCDNEPTHHNGTQRIGITGQPLTSWKEIATHLGVSVRTAQRWEATEGLPVRRHQHSRMSSVYADPEELDRWWQSRPADAPVPSIAVLPFANLDRNEETEILSDGLTEDLITALSQIPQLRVVARSSTFYFKGTSRDVREIGASLGVSSVLEGSLRRSGRRIRVTAQLVNAADGCHLWSRKFDREVEDPFDLQEQLAHAIAGSLRVRLLNAATTLHRTRDTETYYALLRGRFFWNQRTKASLERARRCYEDVVARDPEFAGGHAGIADCCIFQWIYGNGRREDLLPKAEASVNRALELDPALSDAHTTLGSLCVTRYDFPGAEAALSQALDLNPADHRARHWRACVRNVLGRDHEALTDIEHALEQDPYGVTVNQDAGLILYSLGRFDDAILRLRHTLELAPKAPSASLYLCLTLFQSGDHEGAAAAAVDPAMKAWVKARMGDPGDARGLLHRCDENGLGFAWQGVLYQGLGEIKSAVASFRRAAQLFELDFLPLYGCMRPLFRASGVDLETNLF
jgi:TolB-like protein/Flp pilus assembly protein TadD